MGSFRSSVAPTSPCPEENLLVGLAEGTLDGPARDALTGHLDGCEDCRRVVATLVAQRTGRISSGLSGTLTPGSGDTATPTGTSGTYSPGLGTESLASGRTVQNGSAPRPDASAEDLPAGTRLGRLTVLEVLGRGGMGVVYAAYDASLDRRVAVKTIRAEMAPDAAARGRLLLEARAMARLSHPNIVQVYGAAEQEGLAYIELEFVSGRTLREWLKETKRTWREVLEAHLAAAAGLAAAHGQGLVHRDVKPDNVLIAADGRVRVSDFGLAHTGVQAPLTFGSDDPASSAELGTPITIEGALVGTPSYMSPEQIRGEKADARSDQFSLCVCLYESLYGKRPFEGATLRDLKTAITSGPVPPRPPGSPVPARLHAALLRGLAKRAEDRYPSMEALSQALRRAEVGRRLGWLAAAAVVPVGVLATVVALRQSAVASCGEGAALIHNSWDEARAQQVAAAFAGTKVPYAGSAAAQVRRTLDGYAAAWADAYRSACEARRVRREDPEELLALRMVCLRARRVELDALVAQLAAADKSTVDKAVVAAAELGSLSACADLDALQTSDPALAKSSRADVEEVRAELARAEVSRRTAHFADQNERAKKAEARARALNNPALLAEALVQRTMAEENLGHLKDAVPLAKEAAFAAEASRADATAVVAWGRLLQISAVKLGQFEPAADWEQLALAALARLGPGQPEVEAGLLFARGTFEHQRSNYAKALEHARQSYELRRRVLPPEHPRLLASQQLVALALKELGQYEEAIKVARATLEAKRKSVGEDHPAVGKALDLLGSTLRRAGKRAEAREALEAARANFTAALGPDHEELISTLVKLGNLGREEHRFAEAHAAFDEALRISVLKSGPESANAGACLVGKARVLAEEERWKEAVALYVKANPISLKTLGPKNVDTALGVISECEARHHLDKLGAGRPWAECLAALEVLELRYGPTHPSTVDTLVLFGQLELMRGEPSAALVHLRTALERASKAERFTDQSRAAAVLGLAEALAKTKAPREERQRYALEAKALYEKLGEPKGVAEAQALLAN